ncbi:MAG: LUD domain-containing protein [Ectothiorhodospiraceae bacterium]|jgi:L-lactate utilization protein LutC
MSEGKENVLAAVRRALGRDHALSEPTPRAYREDTAPHPMWDGDRVERFLQRFEAAAGTWARVPDAGSIPDAVAEYLSAMNPIRLRLGEHPLLTALQWPEKWEVERGPADAADWPVAMGVAYAGLAETGSVVMPSSSERPTSLNFLPDYHIVVLKAEDVMDYMEPMWRRLTEESGGLPRAVNVITGPSRTADVEQTIQLGAHGPRRVHLLLLG